MTMKKIIYILLLAAISILCLPSTGKAIPAFARKYGFNCNMCHTAFTRLNDFGQRYRDNGYQIPGQTGGEKSVFDTSIPIAMRTTVGISYYKTDQGSTSGFNVYGLDLLGAGVLQKNISFMLIYTPRIDEPAADFTGTAPSQPGAIESANLVFSNIVQDAFNLRVGRFEPAYHPFSSKRKFAIFSNYEVYTFPTPMNNFVFDDNQIGVEATGKLPFGLKYGMGVVNGTGALPDNNTQKDYYLNLSQTVGKGDGQNAGQRVGIFGYYGSQPTKTNALFIGPTGETNGSDNKTFYRFGGHGSFNWEMFNLGILFMKGVDDKDLNPLDPTENYEYTGGLVDFNWAGLMDNRLIVNLMYNFVRPPSYDAAREINAYSAIARYYLGDWSAVNIALHGEYTFRRTGKDNPLDEHLVLLALDFDF
jgi:hypothetical protein